VRKPLAVADTIRTVEKVYPGPVSVVVTNASYCSEI